jgi:hypothetical protein
MRWPWGRTRGRVLRVKPGFNPNSSSLGFDVTFLLAGVGALSMITAVLATAIRVRRSVPHGEPPPAEDA